MAFKVNVGLDMPFKFLLLSKDFLMLNFVVPEFNKSGGPAGHQVRILFGPTEIYTLPVQMSDTIFLKY